MLYRKQSGPVNVWLTVGTALVTLILGFLGGRLTAPQATLSTLLQPAALHLRQASGALDIVSLEYARALQGNVQSRASSRRALEQVGAELSAAEALKQLYPKDVARATQALAAASQAAGRQASQVTMEAQVSQVRAALTSLSDRLPQ
ncbi:hypothetical protein [Deinococcus sp. UYEF24]